MNVPDDIFETRLLTPAELAAFVKAKRDEHKWTQAVLAELAGVTERTIQRVENGEPSTFDTRRAIAKAFECHDLDIFNKPHPVPSPEKLKSYWAELDKTTLIIPITRIRDARTLRTMSEGCHCSAAEELGELSAEARRAFAETVDCLRDYNDVRDAYSMTQRLDLDGDIDTLLKRIGEAGATVGAGLRRGKFRSDAPGSEPMDLTTIYFLLAPNDALPNTVMVPKRVQLA
jgi:transcriptional regulator with XRE-family HTH domain